MSSYLVVHTEPYEGAGTYECKDLDEVRKLIKERQWDPDDLEIYEVSRKLEICLTIT